MQKTSLENLLVWERMDVMFPNFFFKFFLKHRKHLKFLSNCFWTCHSTSERLEIVVRALNLTANTIE